jgi:hypothetical protein
VILEEDSSGSIAPAIEIHCAGCQERLLRPFTTGPVSHEALLVELCVCNVDDLTEHQLAFLVGRPEAQVVPALLKMRRAGLVRCVELDVEAFEASPSGRHWVAAGNLRSLRSKARRHVAAGRRLDLALDISVSTDSEEPKPS